MAVQIKVGSFTVTTTDTVSKAVTGVGFTPQAYALTVTRLGADGSANTVGISVGDGVTDGTRQYAQSFATLDAQTASQSRRIAHTDSVATLVSYDGSVLMRFAHGSFDADGFTLNTTTTPAATYLIKYVAYAGFDNVYCDVFQLPGATGSFSRTAAGFQPDAIRWMTANIITLDTAATVPVRSLGWSISTPTSFAVSARAGADGTQNYTMGTSATDRVLLSVTEAGADAAPSTSITSHDATGFTANRLNGTGASYVAALHLKGGIWHAGTTTAQSSTGTFDITTTGSDPVGVFLAASNITTASRTTPFEGSNICTGAADGTSQWAVSHHSFNNEVLNPNVTEEYLRAANDRVWVHNDRTAANTFTAVGEITLSSLGTEKFTLDQVDADPTAILIGWLAVGNATAGGGSTPVAVFAHHFKTQGIS